MSDEAAERLEEIEQALEDLADRPFVYSDDDKAQAGGFVSLDHDGSLKLDAGWVRPEDDAAQETDAAEDDARQSASVTVGDPEPEEPASIKPLPEKLVMELTAFCTLALRDAVARNPQVALTALLHKLVRDLFHQGYTSGACLEATIRVAHFPERGPDLG